MQQDVVKMVNISKSFGGLKALDNVNFSTRAGEVHALMGENGAGKSTLIKILSGAYKKDSGEIFLDGEKVEIDSPRDGSAHGISVIYQEFALAPHLTVAENIFLDHMGGPGGVIRWKELKQRAEALFQQLGFSDIDVLQPVSRLSVAYQQVVEICKALTKDAKVLVLDEPTAVLSNKETDRLFQIIKGLKAKGVCVIYVSHRLKEIFAICDRITILKDGRNVTCVPVSEIDADTLVSHMIGRSMSEFFPKRSVEIGPEVFRVEGITRGAVVENVSFSVRAGEVLGISGLVGSGRTEAMRLIFGADRKDTGNVLLNGRMLDIRSPKQAVRSGIGMVPEDRKKHGVLLHMPIRVNATLTIVDKFKAAFGLIRSRQEGRAVQELAGRLLLKAGSIEQNASTLSGGNQQKVGLMKWLASKARVLILDEPTRGVDVGAKVEIYKVINELAAEGTAIIMISSEMTEIIGMCDRALVMRQGRIVGEVSKQEITEYNLIHLAMGV